MNLQKFDELKNISTKFSAMTDDLIAESLEKIELDAVYYIGDRKMYDPGKCDDIITDMLIMAYVYGAESTNEMLGKDTVISTEKVQSAVYKKTDGLTFSERIMAYAPGGETNAILKVMTTEAMRVFSLGAYASAEEGGAKAKTWVTVNDDRVRETHSYLEGMRVPLDAEFYTYDGDHAYAPEGFMLPENNINCRCSLLFDDEKIDGEETDTLRDTL